MKVRVVLRTPAALAQGLVPPPGVRVVLDGATAIAEVEAPDLAAALAASEAWLAALRARRS